MQAGCIDSADDATTVGGCTYAGYMGKERGNGAGDDGRHRVVSGQAA